MSFREQMKISAELTEARLAELLSKNAKKGAEALNSAIAYSLLGGGKRLRAYLALEFCRLCSADPINALDYACALEMVHAFSLIHDDLPAMDNDDMRRGKPSCHKAFGEATAILAGDSLALDAFSVACGNRHCSLEQNARAAMLISEKAGSAGMCAGQQFDLDGEGKALDINALTRLVDCKTGALFEAACALGCIGAGREEKIPTAEKFGLLCGRAFQITDDLLDIRSTPEELGKSIGKDLEQQKSTFASLLGIKCAEEYASACIKEAKECLFEFPESESRTRLLDFCDYILIRKK